MWSVVIGIVMVVAGVVVGLKLGKRNLDHARVVSEVPQYDCAQVGGHGADAPGMRIAVQGRSAELASGALVAPLSGRECVWYRLTISERIRETKTDSDGSRSTSESESVVSDETSPDLIALTDATVTVHLDPIGATIDNALETYDRLESADGTLGLQVSIGAVSIKSGPDVIGIRRREEIIPAGVELYVVGGAYDRGGDPVVAAPRQGPFIISTRSGDALESSVRRKGLLWIGAAVLIVGVGIAVAVSGFFG